MLSLDNRQLHMGAGFTVRMGKGRMQLRQESRWDHSAHAACVLWTCLLIIRMGKWTHANSESCFFMPESGSIEGLVEISYL